MINIGQEREVLFWKVHLMNLIAFASGEKMKYDQEVTFILYIYSKKKKIVWVGGL